MEMRRLLLQLLLVFVAQSGADVVHCPLTCTCTMDDMSAGRAACNFGNLTATRLNTRFFNSIKLSIKCTNAVENFQYDCNDWPQFNVSGSYESIVVFMEECAPSAVQCTDKMYAPKLKMVMFVVTRAAGSYTAEDLDVLNSVVNVQIYFRDEDTQIPANIFNHLLNLQTFEIHGGDLQLASNLFNSLNLKKLVLDGNNIRTIPPETFNGLPDLKTLKIFSNSIEHLDTYSLKGLDALTELIIENSTLTTIESNAFSSLKQLTRLHIINNTLKIVPNGLLTDLGNLQELNLNHNELCEFEDWFVELADLQNLDLSGNKIKTIKASHIYRLNKTVTIDLRNNSITEIVNDTSDPLVNVTPSYVTLYLSNNPLQCDCVVTILLKEWHKYGILADYEDIICDNEDKISNLTVYIQCNKAHALVALVGSIAVGSLAIVVILLSIFTQRRKIWEYARNLFHISSSHIPKFSHYSRRHFKSSDVNDTLEITQKVKMYDLFISFSQQDSEFVTNQLLPILENDLKLKICVNYRDTIVDDLYYVQIKESVESSTMTMIILTEYFLESEWSSPEFRTAHDLDIEDGKSNVILILINESITRHDKLCSELKAHINMKSYLVWDNSFFWDKLQNILSKHDIN